MRHTNRAAEKREPIAVDYEGRMDIVMTHALLESLFTIFSTMVNLEIRPGVPEAKQDNIAKGEVSSLIGMQAADASGSVALTLTLPTIREISRHLMGHEITTAGKDAADLAGELCNMLVGGAKRILSERGHDFDMQRPQLLMGEGHEIVHHYAGQTVLLPVQINNAEFYIELNFV